MHVYVISFILGPFYRLVKSPEPGLAFKFQCSSSITSRRPNEAARSGLNIVVNFIG